MKKILIIPVLIALTGCGVNKDDATRILESHGLTDVKIGEHAIFGCSQDDNIRSKWTATNRSGERISGVKS